MVTLSSCLIWQISSFILSPNEYGCLYAWTRLGSGPAIDLQKMPILAKKIIFSDETPFDLGEYVNKQNCLIWGTEYPHAYIEKPKNPKWVTVWCGFWSRCIIGPFFFQNEQGEAVTVNDNRYRAMLNEFLFTKQHLVSIGGSYVPHSLSYTRCFMSCFEDRIISRWLLFMGCRQRSVLSRQARDNWRFKGQYSFSHWWNTTAHNR